MNKPLSVGVAGLGYWGPNLARNFNSLPSCQLSALCDLDEGRRDRMHELYPQAGIFGDFEEMLASDGLDAVAIATPVASHFPLAKAALTAGKHTLIEKPMAASSAECEELIEIAESRGLTLMVGHTFLYSTPVRMIAEIIAKGDLGDILYINSQRLNLGLFQKDINVTWDLAPHDISIVLYLLGHVPEVINCQGNAHITPGIEDVSNISLLFPGSKFATIQSSWLEPRKVRQMTIVGTRRMIVYDDIEPLEKIRIYDVRVDPPPHYDTFGEFQYSYHYGDSYIPMIKQAEPLKVMCQHFGDCISKGEKPMSSGEEGLKMVRILEACSESLATGGGPVQFGDDV